MTQRLMSALMALLAMTFGATQAQAGQTAAHPPTAAKKPHVVRYCTNCATVEAVRVIDRDAGRAAPRTRQYELVIRYANGGTRTFTYENDPGLRAGEKVKVNDGVLVRDQ